MNAVPITLTFYSVDRDRKAGAHRLIHEDRRHADSKQIFAHANEASRDELTEFLRHQGANRISDLFETIIKWATELVIGREALE
jgi:hypothetical protein